jgi:putative membrane protein
VSATSDISAKPALHTAGAKILLFIKGVAMGMGDSVPGISGGTIAVITNIYDTLIFSIRAIDLQMLRLLFAFRFADAWRHINGKFLLLLALGILSGLLLSANTVLYLLANYFEALMAFFIGLVLASTWLLQKTFSLLRWQNLIALFAGMLLTVAIGFVSPQQAELSLGYIFVCGAIAICAMILPGLSGAFILLLLGVYEFILTALIEFNLAYILVFACGCALGLLTFTRLLAWLLHNFYNLSYGFITGMLAGSLSVLWPWQQVLSYYADADGVQHALQSINVWPLHYAQLTGNEPQLLTASLSVVVGWGLVMSLHQLFEKNSVA